MVGERVERSRPGAGPGVGGEPAAGSGLVAQAIRAVLAGGKRIGGSFEVQASAPFGKREHETVSQLRECLRSDGARYGLITHRACISERQLPLVSR